LVLNLFGFVKNPFTKDAYFDYREFYETSQIAQRLMDDLVDLEEECILKIVSKVKNDPECDDTKIRELRLWENVLTACRNGRRTGTGITALGDTLAAINVPYGSPQGVSTVERIYRTLKFGAYRSSVDMAKEIGTFPIWDHNAEKNNPFLIRIKNEFISLNSPGQSVDNVEGIDIWDDMKKYGRRNISLLTTAPTGTVSIVTKLINSFGSSSGIEPQFDITPYTRKKKGNPGDKNFRVDETDQNGDHWMHFNVMCPAFKDWVKVTGNTDHTQSPWWGHCANQLNWQVRVELQAAAQRHVDHSISSTVNLPNDVSCEEVMKIYNAAWKAGCKGITVYRDGCRSGVLVRNTSPKATGIPHHDALKRPQTLPCDIHHVKSKGDDYFILVGLYDGKDPYEIFAGKNGFIPKTAKTGTITKMARGEYQLICDNGTTINSIAKYIEDEEEAITRGVSLSLRHGIDVSYIVHQYEKIESKDMNAFYKALCRTLKKYIREGSTVSGEECPECKGKLVRESGCASCRNCGWSKCS
jgi:ribonucleoside-diphosphate reductase alpha chain